jgi:hypothetical protein
MFKHLTVENDFVKCSFDNYVGREGRRGEGGDLVQAVVSTYISFSNCNVCVRHVYMSI